LSLTAAWYKLREQCADMQAFSNEQISQYEQIVAAR